MLPSKTFPTYFYNTSKDNDEEIFDGEHFWVKSEMAFMPEDL